MRTLFTAFSAIVLLAAGFFRYFEVLTEWIAVGYFMFHRGVAIPQRSKRSINVSNHSLQMVIDFLYRKRDAIADLLHGGSPGKAISKIILGGVVLGWLLALSWFFFRDYRFVAARELIETVLDVFLFGATFYILRYYYRGYLSDLTKAKAKDESETATARTAEDAILSEPKPKDDYGEPVGQFGAFSIGGSLQDRLHMDYFIRRGLRGQSIFATVDDVREEEDHDAQGNWEARVSRGFVLSGYSIVIVGALLFLAGFLLSLIHFIPITDIVSELIFPPSIE